MPDKLEEKKAEERTPEKGEPAAKGEPDPTDSKGSTSKGDPEPTKPTGKGDTGKQDSGKEPTGKEDSSGDGSGAVINPDSFDDGSESSNDISNDQVDGGSQNINPDSATFDNDEASNGNSISQDGEGEAEAVSEDDAADSESSSGADASNNGAAPEEGAGVEATDSAPAELDDPPMGEIPEGEDESESSVFDDVGLPGQGEPEKGIDDDADTGPQLPTHGGEVDIDAPEFVASDDPPELIDPRVSGIENKAPVDLSDPDPTSPTDGSEPSIDFRFYPSKTGSSSWVDWDSGWDVQHVDGVLTATNGDEVLTGEEAFSKWLELSWAQDDKEEANELEMMAELDRLEAEHAAAVEAEQMGPPSPEEQMGPPSPKDDGSSGDPAPATSGGVNHPGWDGTEGGDPALQDELRRIPGERIIPIEGDIDYHDEGYGDGGGDASSTSQKDLTQPVDSEDTSTFGSGTNSPDPAPIDYGPDHVEDPSEPGSYIDPTTGLGGDNVTIELDDGSIDVHEHSYAELDDGAPAEEFELADGSTALLDAAE